MPVHPKKWLASSVMDGVALFSGALLTLAFAPFSCWVLAILSPAFLLSVWLNATPLRACWRGWLFGCGLFGTGVYWVFISIYEYGHAPFIVALLITISFIALLAFFPAIVGYVFKRFFPKPLHTALIYAFPALWVLLEWIRSWILTGFPWLLLGSSQVTSPLKGYAPIIGVYGVSLAVILTSAFCVDAVLSFKQKQNKHGLLCIIGVVLLWGLGAVLSTLSWTQPYRQPIKVSLVQGNIPQTLKWSVEEIIPTLQKYRDLTEKHWDSSLIVWPEAAIPLTFQDAYPFLMNMNKKAYQHHAAIILGIPIKATLHELYYNGVVTIGNGQGVYIKRFLVPFGEYIPMPRLLGRFFNVLNIPFPESTPGPMKAKPIEVQGIHIATFICYEIAYPELALYQEPVQLLLTVSNDAWFGRSIAQAQHLEIAAMRALELGKPLLFVSNNGITAVIHPNGTIQSQVPPFEPAVLTDIVQPMTGQTPWTWLTLNPVLLTIVVFLWIAVRLQRKTRDITNE